LSVIPQLRTGVGIGAKTPISGGLVENIHQTASRRTGDKIAFFPSLSRPYPLAVIHALGYINIHLHLHYQGGVQLLNWV
jgi:hypothetical protein